MYDTDLVRKLCVDILHEKDSQKAEELISLMQAVKETIKKKSGSEWRSSPGNTRMPSATRKRLTNRVPLSPPFPSREAPGNSGHSGPLRLYSGD